MNLLDGKVAVVTGSGRGIGESIIRTLAQYRARVIVTDIEEESARNVAKDLELHGFEAKYMVFDVSDFANIRMKVAELKAMYGRIDIWVNNAGITEALSIEAVTVEKWDRMQDINLKSVFFCTQAVYEIMKEQRYGKLVHIASMAGERGGRGSSASYSASKAGVINISKSFALNGGQYGITSNAICPGRTLTKMAEGLSWLHDPKDDPKLTIPMQRFGTPQDIANAVLFFASDLSGYVTGDTMDVNGGLYIR